MTYSLKNQLRYSLWNTKHPMIGRQFQITRNQIDTNHDFQSMRPYPPTPQQGFAKHGVHTVEEPLSFGVCLHTLLFNFRLIFFSARRVPEARFKLARGIPSQDFKFRVSSNSTTLAWINSISHFINNVSVSGIFPSVTDSDVNRYDGEFIKLNDMASTAPPLFL